MTKEMIDAIKATKSVDELKEVATKNGYSLTDEDIKNFYDAYHNSGKIDEDELDNVSGGGCQTYSSDSPHHLIVASVNSCKGYKEVDPLPIGFLDTCSTCKYSYTRPPVMYCSIRKKDSDPYK